MKHKEREHKLPKSRMKEDTLLGSTKIKMGCQQAHEKMLNIYNHQRNVNQNHNEISSQTCQHGYHKKEHKQPMLTRIWRKENPRTLLVGHLFIFFKSWVYACQRHFPILIVIDFSNGYAIFL